MGWSPLKEGWGGAEEGAPAQIVNRLICIRRWTPFSPFPPSFIEHMWKPGGEIPSSLGTDLNNIFHLFLHFNIKKFWSIWWCFFLLIFSFSELWKWVGWSLRSRGTDPAEAKESPWSPFARVNVRHSINRNKDFSRANKQKLLCATKCRSILKFSLVSPFSFSSWSPVVSSC